MRTRKRRIGRKARANDAEAGLYEGRGRAFWRRGSFTVEAAVAVPLAFVLVAALVLLSFAMHDRVWFFGAACEAAIAGNAEGEEGGGEAAVKSATARIEDRVLPGAAPLLEIENGKTGTLVLFSGLRRADFLWANFPWKTKAEIRRVHPSKRLQNWWMMKQLGKELLGSDDEE